MDFAANPFEVPIIEFYHVSGIHRTPFSRNILIFDRMPDNRIVFRKLPKGETKDIDAIFTDHSFMV
jgi:hypothetical protein